VAHISVDLLMTVLPTDDWVCPTTLEHVSRRCPKHTRTRQDPDGTCPVDD